MAIGEISAVLASLKTAIDLAGKVKSSRKISREASESLTKVLQVLLAVQTDAVAMHAKHQEVIAEKDQLRKQLMQFEKWSETEKEYDLRSVGPGISVYVYNKTNESSKPVHWLCPSCWEERTKSILQSNYDHSTHASYSCPKCKYEFKWAKPDAPPMDFRVGGRRRDNSW